MYINFNNASWLWAQDGACIRLYANESSQLEPKGNLYLSQAVSPNFIRLHVFGNGSVELQLSVTLAGVYSLAAGVVESGGVCSRKFLDCSEGQTLRVVPAAPHPLHTRYPLSVNFSLYSDFV